MFDGDGGETLELQAQQVVQNATMYRGSHPCPQCGVIMNPVQYMTSKGLCQTCHEERMQRRIKGGMSR